MPFCFITSLLILEGLQARKPGVAPSHLPAAWRARSWSSMSGARRAGQDAFGVIVPLHVSACWTISSYGRTGRTQRRHVQLLRNSRQEFFCCVCFLVVRSHGSMLGYNSCGVPSFYARHFTYAATAVIRDSSWKSTTCCEGCFRKRLHSTETRRRCLTNWDSLLGFVKSMDKCVFCFALFVRSTHLNKHYGPSPSTLSCLCGIKLLLLF